MYLRGILYEYIQQTSFVIVMSCTIFIRVRPHVITHKDCCPLSMLIKRNVFIHHCYINTIQIIKINQIMSQDSYKDKYLNLNVFLYDILRFEEGMLEEVVVLGRSTFHHLQPLALLYYNIPTLRLLWIKARLHYQQINSIGRILCLNSQNDSNELVLVLSVIAGVAPPRPLP